MICLFPSSSLILRTEMPGVITSLQGKFCHIVYRHLRVTILEK